MGITEYVCKGEGFAGVLKSRFSDFHLNEIDLNGKVLQLNDLEIPEPKEERMFYIVIFRIMPSLISYLIFPHSSKYRRDGES